MNTAINLSGGSFTGTFSLTGSGVYYINRTTAGSWFNGAWGTGATIGVGSGTVIALMLDANGLGTVNTTLENPITSSGGTFYAGAGSSSAGTITLSGTMALASGTTVFSSDWSDKPFIFGGQITGSGSIAFNGQRSSSTPPSCTYNVTSVNNNYTGSTIVETTSGNANKQILQLTANQCLPYTSGVVLGDGYQRA